MAPTTEMTELKPKKPVKINGRIPRALRARAETILATEVAYMDSPVFKSKGLEKQLFSEEVPELPRVSWYQPTREETGELAASTPQLMKADEERLQFTRFNFAKRKVKLLQKRIQLDGLTAENAAQLVEWFDRAEHLREYLVRTNLALVLAMAKRTRLGDVDFAEIVSEGNMALLRAVEKFNVDRGFKFSTYACRAILKAFSRTAQKHSRHRTRFPVEFEPDLERSDWSERRRDAVEQDLVGELKTIVDRNLADLSDVERTVIKQRFNWEQETDNPLTLEEVGQIIGVTKERVRQIQNKALIKIRRLMEEGVLKTRDDATGPAVTSSAAPLG
ncbi:MAG: sigma-70 family RNA polymerase sigma factor [Tepidisphaeraceae bacterium]